MITDRELAERAQRIRRLNDEAIRAAARECELIAEIGKILIRTKKEVGHGQWLPWLADHVNYSEDKAQRYMSIASNTAALRNFFPQGKTALYALLDLEPEIRARITPDTVVNGKRLGDMKCDELHAAVRVLEGNEPKGPSPVNRGLGHVAALEKLKESDPATWSEIADDVARLLAGPVEKPEKPAGVALGGATREERGRELVRLLRELLALVDDVDDVPGRLPPELKQQAMIVVQAIWREVNALPAWAVLPKNPDRPSRTGPVTP